MKYRVLFLLCLVGTLVGKAQTNEIQLDADGIMRVGAPVTIVTIGNSITAGYSNTSAYWAWPAQMERMQGPEYQVKN
jgi:lysophospholipase L1-like esterase